MHPTSDEFPTVLASAYRHVLEYLDKIHSRPAATLTQAPPLVPLPERGCGATDALAALIERYGSTFSTSSGPRYWGFVNGGVTPGGLAGDWLCSAIDQNAQMCGDGSAVHIEAEAVAMLRELFSLPDQFTGCFVSGGTMANFTCLAIALQVLGSRAGVNVSEQGVGALGRVRILSGEYHASIAKAAAMLGIGRNSVEGLPLRHGGESLDIGALKERLVYLGGQPVIIVANAGTVNTGSFDDIHAVADLAENFGAHLHVDGAFGIFARCSPRHKHLADGLERADTIAGDAHKWLNVPYDSGFIFSRHIEHQMAMFKSASAYLPEPTLNDRNYQHLSPENSRRLRALPAWLTLRAYGREGYRKVVEQCTELATELASRIEKEPGFRLLAPVALNVVCFQPLDDRGEPLTAEANRAFLERIRDDGRIFITQSHCFGESCVRLAMVNWRTGQEDLDIAMEAMRDCR